LHCAHIRKDDESHGEEILAFPFLTGFDAFLFRCDGLAQNGIAMHAKPRRLRASLLSIRTFCFKNAGATTAINEEIQKLVEYVLVELARRITRNSRENLLGGDTKQQGLVSSSLNAIHLFSGSAHPTKWRYARTFSEQNVRSHHEGSFSSPPSDWETALDERMSPP
jgi:hypothetical protein